MKQGNYRVVTILFGIILLLSLSGCVSVTLNSSGSGKNGTVKGKGEIVSREYTLDEYSSVKVDANVQLVYTAEASSTVEAEGYENLMDYLEISVEDGTLLITSEKNFSTNSSLSNIPIVYISSTTLESVISYGAIKFTQSDIIKGESFKLELRGAGDVELPIEVNNLSASISGAGSLTLTGSAQNAGIILNGAGDVDALELETSIADVTISGAGIVSINCSDTLTATISGVGSLEYRGDADVHKNVSGLGTVSKVN